MLKPKSFDTYTETIMPQQTLTLTKETYQNVLLRITHIMLNTVSHDDFFTKVLQEIGEKTQASRVYIFDRTTQGLWNNTFEWCAENIKPTIGTLQDFHENNRGHTHFFQQIRNGKSYIYDNTDLIPDKRIYDIFLTQSILSVCIIPLYEDNEVCGFFGFDMCEKPTKWTASTLDIFIAIANLLNSARGHFKIKEKLEHKTSKFQAILDAFPDPIYIIDMDTYEILFCNLFTRTVFPKTALANIPCYEALQGLDEPCSFCTNDALRKATKPITWTHYNPIAKRVFRVLDCCIEWQGREQARLSAAQDITDFLDAKKNEVLANEASVAKNVFLSNMSHELRTPLNAISGLIHLAEEHCQDPTIKSYLTKVQASTFTLHALVNNMLDYTKIDSNDLMLDLAPFNICTIIEKISDTFTHELEAKNLFIRRYIDDSLQQNILGDSFRVAQIIINIMSNAIKFTNQGGITLSCLIQKSTASQAIVKIQIQDTGIGLKESDRQNLFQIFNQADSSFTRAYGGTGMGLAITYKLIKLMGGDINVASVLDEGSIFTITIPFTFIDDTSLAQTGSPVAKIHNLQNIRILVAEDNLINQIITREILEKEGAIVDTAINGKEAIAMLESTQYDIILMDIQMPVIDGITATKYIRQIKDCNQLPIIALTAHSQQDDKEKNLEAGMQDHITKPTNPEELINTLLKWLNA